MAGNLATKAANGSKCWPMRHELGASVRCNLRYRKQLGQFVLQTELYPHGRMRREVGANIAP